MPPEVSDRHTIVPARCLLTYLLCVAGPGAPSVAFFTGAEGPVPCLRVESAGRRCGAE